MNAERWHRVSELFHAAREMPAAEREDFLRSQCGQDSALVSEVRGMLREDSRSCLLDRPLLTSQPSASVFSHGQLVSGRYRIVRFLGRGGMGEVFEAEDRELKGRVALKTLLPSIASDRRMLARFKQEIQLSRRVSHPNVCRVFDLARHPADAAPADATAFLTMEFLDGETLAARLHREGRISPADALPLLAQMADALDAAHRAGVIHRDFKPGNVMLVPSAEGLRAVVTDFGLARSFTAGGETTATLTGTLMGTLAYMAPELMSGSSASIASDVYAFGTTAYQMIAGALPFPSGTPLAGAIRRAKGPPPSPRTLVPGLDPKWEQAILRALDPEPERRFSRAGHLVKTLRGEALSLSIRIPVMTRRRVIAGAAAAIMLIAAILGWQTWSRLRNQPSAEGLQWYQMGAAALRDATYYRAARALERAISIDPGFGLAHARLAEAWNELDDSEKAKGEMLQALAAQSSHPAARTADALYVDAIHRTLMGDFPAAIRTYKQLLGQAPAAEVAQILVDLGRTQQSNGEPSNALESYRLARQRDPNNAAAHLRTGILLGRSGELREAGSEFDLADSLYLSLSNTEGQTEVLYQRGVLASTTGELPEARAELEKAIQLSKATSATYQEIAATLQLSVVTYQEGNAEGAERLASGATRRARDSGMANMAARGLTALGNAQFLKVDFSRAETTLQEALALARRYQLRRYEARALLSLANLHQQQGAADAVLKEAESALAFYRQAGFRGETISCLTLIARANRDKGKYEEALHAFEQQRSLAEGTNDQKQMAFAEQGIATVLFRQEHWPDALTRYQRYYNIASSIQSRDGIGRALLGQADILWRLGRHEEASKTLDETEKFTGPPGSAGQLPSLIAAVRAAVAFSRGLYRESAAWARRTSDMAGTTGQVQALTDCIGGLALVRAGSISEGKRLCSAGSAAAAALDDRFVALEDQLAMAEILLAAGEAHAADETARNALEDFERTGRKESAWRAWAIVAQSRRRSGDLAGATQAAQAASDRLAELRTQWGPTAFDGYLHRADLAALLQATRPGASVAVAGKH